MSYVYVLLFTVRGPIYWCYSGVGNVHCRNWNLMQAVKTSRMSTESCQNSHHLSTSVWQHNGIKWHVAVEHFAVGQGLMCGPVRVRVVEISITVLSEYVWCKPASRMQHALLYLAERNVTSTLPA